MWLVLLFICAFWGAGFVACGGYVVVILCCAGLFCFGSLGV